MVAPSIRKRVPSAAGPKDDSGKEWVAFGVRQTGQLDIANERGDTILEITDECERQNKAIRQEIDKMNRPWWKIF